MTSNDLLRSDLRMARTCVWMLCVMSRMRTIPPDALREALLALDVHLQKAEAIAESQGEVWDREKALLAWEPQPHPPADWRTDDAEETD